MTIDQEYVDQLVENLAQQRNEVQRLQQEVQLLKNVIEDHASHAQEFLVRSKAAIGIVNGRRVTVPRRLWWLG